jgi:23S rRNA pseudouridine955/2504/2580 synthase
MTVLTIPVKPGDAGARLDRWFKRHYPTLTQGALQKMLRSGQIRVDGKRAEAATRVNEGQEIRVPPMPSAPPPIAVREPDEKDAAELAAMVLYRDDHVIVLDKPHGLAVQGGPGIVRHLDGMLDALRFGEEDRPRLVHRLDRDTSGVLILGRTPAATAALAAAFRTRDAKKTYWAVVVGEPEPAGGRVDMPLARVPGPRGERTGFAPEGQRAITDYDTLERVNRRAALMEMRPLTGRTHQLRVHCASIGAPILGDAPYGSEKQDEGNRNSALVEGFPERLHLHARRLSLPHPEGGTLTVEAELPAHMIETFKALAFSAPPPFKPKRTR